MDGDRVHFLCQDFARQGQIDRALRCAERHFQRPVDDCFNLLPIAQLVIPTGKLAQQAALIERLLAPVDEVGSAAAQPFLGERRSAGRKNHRHIEARGVHHRRRSVPSADDHMNHNDLRLSRNHGVALRHTYRDKFMGNRDRFREFLFLRGEFRQPVDNRPKVGAAIAEEIFNPASPEDFQIGLPDGLYRYCDWFVYFHRIAPRYFISD
jgi:hypothetical protein